MDLLLEMARAIWLFLPAGFANMAPLFIPSVHPIDGHRNWFDGKQLFGNGKTWEGLLFAVGVGGLVGFFMGAVQAAYGLGSSFIQMTPKLGLAIGLGAMLGDLTKSFFKRRAGLKRGDPAFPIDQLDFVIGGLIAASFFVEINPVWVLILVIVIPVLHRILNIEAHRMHKKEESW